jgi:hypothetical protein
MASFENPEGAVRTAVDMQRKLEEDRHGRPEIEQIHIRVGLHTGMGLIKEDDVFGDVVNAASRVQRQAQPDQILITDVLLPAAEAAGFRCVKLGKADLRGKDEPIDVYAVAWSESASDQLIEELHAQFERKMKEMKGMHEQIENDFEATRDQWRQERRRLNSEIERLEESLQTASDDARRQVSGDLQSEIRFQLEETLHAREQSEQDFAAATAKWQSERNALKSQIDAMQRSVIEGIERSNNPVRMALAVREQVDARLAREKEDWQLQWDAERKRLTAEIERLRKSTNAKDDKKEAARRAVLESLGKLPAGVAPSRKSADEWETEFHEARIRWENERDQLSVTIRKLENEIQRNNETTRSELFHEIRASYEPRLAEEIRERERLTRELESANLEHEAERQRLLSRIEQLEKSVPEAQEATRKQLIAELRAEYDSKIEDASRTRSRLERRFQDMADEFEAGRRRDAKQIAQLEEQLKEARETAFKAQRKTT